MAREWTNSPDRARDEQAELGHVEETGAALPKGTRLRHDGRCRATGPQFQEPLPCSSAEDARLASTRRTNFDFD